MKNKEKHLYHLDELSDYKVADNYSNVKGWNVKDSDNRVIGKVDNLLVNKELERVVYIDVEVDHSIIEANHDPYGRPENAEVHEFMNTEGENHIIIPIGLIDINEDQKFVYTNTINHQTFAQTKRIKTGVNIDRQYEETVLKSYRRDRDRDEEAKDNFRKEEKYSSERENDKEFERKKLEEERQVLIRERQVLIRERQELKEERKKLEEERLKLEEERQRNDSEFLSDKKEETITSSDEVDENDLAKDTYKETSKEDDFYDDDSFYDRDEFGGSNY